MSPNLTDIIEDQLAGMDLKSLRSDTFDLGINYRNGIKSGPSFIESERSAFVYMASRMTATYQVCSRILNSVRNRHDISIDSVLDVGAGTGSASWAAYEIFSPSSVRLIDSNENMILKGRELMSCMPELDSICTWDRQEIGSFRSPEKYDLVIESYVLNELKEEYLDNALKSMYDTSGKLMILIEPGTSKGFEIIRKAKEICNKRGWDVIAPCPSNDICPLGNEERCSFSLRIPRKAFLKYIKNGDAPFEDEKYCYLIISKGSMPCIHRWPVILKHPTVKKGHIILNLCSGNRVYSKVLSKKDGDAYRTARKSSAGDTLEPEIPGNE